MCNGNAAALPASQANDEGDEMTPPRGKDPLSIPATHPAAPELPNEATLQTRARTALAVERTFLAAERSLMAWLRTSLSMISFGFTLAKFFEYVAHERGSPIVGRFGTSWSPRAVGTAMVVIGTAALIVAVIQHGRRVAALRREGLVQQWNLAFWIGIAVAALGAFALGSLVLD
jgi:putative membrane protein